MGQGWDKFATLGHLCPTYRYVNIAPSPTKHPVEYPNVHPPSRPLSSHNTIHPYIIDMTFIVARTLPASRDIPES